MDNPAKKIQNASNTNYVTSSKKLLQKCQTVLIQFQYVPVKHMKKKLHLLVTIGQYDFKQLLYKFFQSFNMFNNIFVQLRINLSIHLSFKLLSHN